MDCMDFMKSVPNNTICLTITSPPYNLGENHHTSNKRFKAYDLYIDDIPEDIYQNKQIEVLNEIFRITKDGGSIMYNHKNRIKNGKQITPYEWILKTKWTIKQEIVWQNRTPNMDKCRMYPSTERIYWLSKGINTDFINAINSTDIFKDEPVGTEKLHKRAFPLSLVRKLIICFPNAKNIFDPYMGSGTTMVGADSLGRDFIGCEISENYYKAALKRFEDHKLQLKLL